MSYKFTIKEASSRDDWFASLGMKPAAADTISKAKSYVAAANAKKVAADKAEKEKAEKTAAAQTEKQRKEAEKQRKAADKQYARDFADLVKQDKRDKKVAAQKVIDDSRKEIAFLKTVTGQLRLKTGLFNGFDNSILQNALDAITDRYIGRGTLVEADELDIKPLPKSTGSAVFRKYYGNILDANIFSQFETAQQIINFLYIYEQNLKQVQTKVSQLTGGKKLKISPNLVTAFDRTNKYVAQITGQ